MEEEEDLRKTPVSPEKLRELIKASVAKLGPDVSKESKLELAKMMLKIFEKGKTPMEAMEVGMADISRLYSYAYHLYGAGKFVEAQELFKVLVLLDPTHGQFATSLGVCFHRQKNYRDALSAYMLSAVLSPSDPVPFLYAYDCYMNLNDEISAGIMLGSVISRSTGRSEFTKVKERAELLTKELTQKIQQRQAPMST